MRIIFKEKDDIYMSEACNTINIFVCDDSVDDIFTAIYMAWEAGTSHTDIRCLSDAVNLNYSFFETYTRVKADSDISNKVARSIQKKLGDHIYGIIFTVICSNEQTKASIVYHSLQKLFKYGRKYIDNIHDEYIYELFAIYRKVSNEAAFYREIIRFSENKLGILLARIEPDNNIIYMLTDHFTDRLHCENFIIYDIKRRFCYIHTANGCNVFYNDSDKSLYNKINSYSDYDIECQSLWKNFFNTIAIKERTNHKLQMNMLPVKYRKYLSEFD